MRPTVLRASNVRFDYAGSPVLDGVDLELVEGEIVVIHGPSGCGKTTLLKILLGFITARCEELSFRGSRVTGPGPDFGYIAQDDSLFPWFTLRQNLLAGSRVRAEPPAEQDRLVERFLNEFGLGGFGERYANQLSGGQRQRGALARALINRPVILFADEPFRALDTVTRLSLLEFLWREARAFGLTVCMVSHDIDESLLLADRIILLGGRPARVLGEFPVRLAEPRTANLVLASSFHELRREYAEFCRRVGAEGLPVEEGPTSGVVG